MTVPNSADISDRPGSAHSDPPISGDALAIRLGDIARELQHEEDPDSVLAGIVHAALELVPHADDASVSLVTGRRTIDSRAARRAVPEKTPHGLN